jgi:hypothetical protein
LCEISIFTYRALETLIIDHVFLAEFHAVKSRNTLRAHELTVNQFFVLATRANLHRGPDTDHSGEPDNPKDHETQSNYF